MTLACVIPARYNSSRFPGKLLESVLGKTILERTYECATKSSAIDHLYIATDDERIASHVVEIGGDVLWTSSAPRDGTERTIEALKTHPLLQTATYIMVLQGDHPCTSPEIIEKIAAALRKDHEAVLSTAAAPIQHLDDYLSPHVVKCVVNKQGRALYFSRSPIPYTQPGASFAAFAHIGIYCYKRSFLQILPMIQPTDLQISEDLEQLKVLESGYPIAVALVDEKPPSVDIPSDLLKLKEYLCKKL